MTTITIPLFLSLFMFMILLCFPFAILGEGVQGEGKTTQASILAAGQPTQVKNWFLTN